MLYKLFLPKQTCDLCLLTGLIVGCVILVIAVLAAVVCVIVYVKKKNSRQNVAPETPITITHSKRLHFDHAN